MTPQAAPPSAAATKRQAIPAIRGKIASVEKARLVELCPRTRSAPSLHCLRDRHWRRLRYLKLRYGKIVIMADADVDMASIAALLLTLLFHTCVPVRVTPSLRCPRCTASNWTNAEHEFAYSDRADGARRRCRREPRLPNEAAHEKTNQDSLC